MKLKGRIVLKLLLIFVLTTHFFIFPALSDERPSFADSGFDTSYDGGGSSGGGGYRSSRDGSSDFFDYLVIPFSIISAIFVIFYPDKEQKQTLKKTKIIKQYIPDFNLNNFLMFGYKIYYDVQMAIMNNNLENVRTVISNELYNTYQSRLLELQNRNQQKITKDFILRNSYLKDVNVTNKIITITTEYTVEFYNYIIDKSSGKVISGDEKHKLIATYEIKYSKYLNAPNWVLVDKKILKKKYEISIEEQVQKYIPDFDKEQFLYEGFKIYCDVQMAWMNFNLDSVKDVITDEMYNMYESQLQTLQVKGEQNIMGQFVPHYSELTDLSIQNDTITLTTMHTIELYDFIIKQSTGKVLRGSSTKKMKVTYEMKFRKSLNQANKVTKCPNCGAEINMNTSGICDYCHTKLVTENTQWVLTDKKVIYQCYPQ